MNLRKCINIISEHLRLLRRPVVVNAFLSFDANGDVVPANWGDDINWYFLREIVDRPVVLLNRTSLAFRFNFRSYLVVGSTIDMLCRPNTDVWGSGIIDDTKPLKILPHKVYAVRGPLTRNRLRQLGVKCPEVYGDPAMLIPLYYRPEKKPIYRYGIVAHVSNLDMVGMFTLEGRPLAEREDVLVIRLDRYTHWHDVVDQICSCEAILSSSLHGLIMAEAYGIPNVWLKFGRPLVGNPHFKFHDFFLSIGRDRPTPVAIADFCLPVQEIEASLSAWRPGHIDLTPLLEACPFALRNVAWERDK